MCLTDNPLMPEDKPPTSLDDLSTDGIDQDIASPSSARAKSVARTAWTGIKEALKITESFADGFPPLKLVVSGLNTVLDRIDMVQDAQEDLAGVKDKINGFADMIRKYQGLDDNASTEKSSIYVVYSAIFRTRSILNRRIDSNRCKSPWN
ncbi:hypothetical protein EWM64_g7257 [Hericium alpestre]|uniref:Uncharacterized protein n=1 Tax=Hericium alpestre TaxID=135208 RepID=A0A4Y9ZPD6_9AGAM|nr:hypothetical protein EWM64_g7257 [Hericium alpestre]